MNRKYLILGVLLFIGGWYWAKKRNPAAAAAPTSSGSLPVAPVPEVHPVDFADDPDPAPWTGEPLANPNNPPVYTYVQPEPTAYSGPQGGYRTGQGYTAGDVSDASLARLAPETSAYLNSLTPFGQPLFNQFLEVRGKGGDPEYLRAEMKRALEAYAAHVPYVPPAPVHVDAPAALVDDYTSRMNAFQAAPAAAPVDVAWELSTNNPAVQAYLNGFRFYDARWGTSDWPLFDVLMAYVAAGSDTTPVVEQINARLHAWRLERGI